MKKLILAVSALLATSSVFAQPFANGNTGFTESFGTSGTSCLKNFSNAGYQFADGNIASASNNEDRISVTAAASLASGLAAGLFDFYYTDGSDNCSPMRTANIGVDMSSASDAKMLVRARASADGVTVQFHMASAPNAYPSTTTASAGIPVAQTQKTLTTTYANYLVDYAGTEWNATPAAFKGKINMWGIIFPDDNATNAGASIEIEFIKIGDQATTSARSANEVNNLVSLFPNPAKGQFTLDMTAMNNVEPAIVKVMNANGMLVKEVTTSAAEFNMTTEGMSKGIYMVQITSGNKVANKKVVVE